MQGRGRMRGKDNDKKFYLHFIWWLLIIIYRIPNEMGIVKVKYLRFQGLNF